jgi:hypothetical protein
MNRPTLIAMGVLLACLLPCGACRQADSNDVEAQPGAEKSTAGESAWSIGWSQLRSGMDPVEVLSLIDEPINIKVARVNTTWYYSQRGAEGPHVVFDTRQMRVERWRAPKGR